jgi:hypothetical protein
MGALLGFAVSEKWQGGKMKTVKSDFLGDLVSLQWIYKHIRSFLCMEVSFFPVSIFLKKERMGDYFA